jgi:CubicO group peptidase (beta-lactamase class C family)
MKQGFSSSLTSTLLNTVLIFFAIHNCVFAQDKSAKIDELMQRYHDYGQFDGAVLVAEDGKVVFKKGYGLANKEWDIPNDPDTKFRIASITKQITAMAIMILQEEGKLHVHDSICKYVPECPEAWKDITIHHLLTNTSGIPNFQNFPDNDQYERLPITVEKTVERFKYKELMFSPGTQFGYSSSGFVLLGYIIEQVTGKSYEDVINQYIFEPLEMKNSGYDHPRTVLIKRASGYAQEGNITQNAIHFEMDTPHAAGALYSTVEDLFLWDKALYTTRLIAIKTLDSIFTEYVKLGEEWGYGYGWFIGQLFNRKLALHQGSIAGFRAHLFRFPDEKAFIISLSNCEQVNLFKINEGIAAIIFDEKYEPPKKYIKDTLYQTIQQKDVVSAVNLFTELRDKHPDDYDFSKDQLNWLGVELRDTGMFDEAIAIYKWIIELHPDWWNAYNGIADVYRIRGDKELAIKYYAKSLEMNPEMWYAKQVSEVMKELTEQDD